MRKIKELSRREKQIMINNLFYILIGNLAIAVGTAFFLTELGIVAGGLSGIGIIIQHYVGQEQMVDIFVLIATWLLWLIGLLFLGKEFALKTLSSAILYPLLLMLFMRADPLNIADKIAYYGVDDAAKQQIIDGTMAKPIGNLLVCAIFGGVFIGIGVAFNFRGGGSTGGVDVLIALGNKYLGIKESVSSFVIDGSIIVVAMFAIPNNIVPALIGILSAFLTSFIIEIMYVSSESSYQADIISDKWEEISAFVQDDLGRGATIIPAKGGFKGEERVILRVVFPKSQLVRLKKCITKIDDKAFVTFGRSEAVYGEGFKRIRRKNTKNK